VNLAREAMTITPVTLRTGRGTTGQRQDRAAGASM